MGADAISRCAWTNPLQRRVRLARFAVGVDHRQDLSNGLVHRGSHAADKEWSGRWMRPGAAISSAVPISATVVVDRSLKHVAASDQGPSEVCRPHCYPNPLRRTGQWRGVCECTACPSRRWWCTARESAQCPLAALSGVGDHPACRGRGNEQQQGKVRLASVLRKNASQAFLAAGVLYNAAGTRMASGGTTTSAAPAQADADEGTDETEREAKQQQGAGSRLLLSLSLSSLG